MECTEAQLEPDFRQFGFKNHPAGPGTKTLSSSTSALKSLDIIPVTAGVYPTWY
jgi:hypothetical protein